MMKWQSCSGPSVSNNVPKAIKSPGAGCSGSPCKENTRGENDRPLIVNVYGGGLDGSAACPSAA